MKPLEELEARMVEEERDSATGLLLEVITPYYRQFIGPFPKDTADIYMAMERLSNEQDPDEEKNSYKVHLLSPVESSEVPRDK